MRFQNRAKLFAIEIAWLLGSWAISYVLVGILVSYSSTLDYQLFWPTPLDIQLHNTYFVLGIFEATLPFFLLIALLATSIRVLLGGFRQAATITLGGLVLLLLVAAALVGAIYMCFPG